MKNCKFMLKLMSSWKQEKSYELLEVNAHVIMTDQDYIKKIGGKNE